MIRPDRASLAHTAPLVDLLALLLRQFRRPLAAHELALTDEEAVALAVAAAGGTPPDERVTTVREAMVRIVAESEDVLRQWGLTFEQSMETGMNDIPGWESTAEFLAIADVKSNAEIRIAAGAALVVALGDPRYVPYLRYLAARDDDDVDTAIARRVLAMRQAADDV